MNVKEKGREQSQQAKNSEGGKTIAKCTSSLKSVLILTTENFLWPVSPNSNYNQFMNIKHQATTKNKKINYFSKSYTFTKKWLILSLKS